MIHSMTGYGKAEVALASGKLHLELRSVNSKSMDLNIQSPGVLRGLESAFRKTIIAALERGKVDCKLYFENEPSSNGLELNYPLIKKYQKDLNELSSSLKLEKSVQLSQIMKLPDVFIREGSKSLSAKDVKTINSSLKKSIASLVRYRRTEGAVLEKDILKRIGLIEKSSKQIERYDKKRLGRIKSKFTKQFKAVSKQGELDQNRFEQELIYYIEKLDLTEEKVRLQAHCTYFKKTMKSKVSVGKKLGFISQEIGREINTIGSKANDADIQRIIVGAKDELEKIKEQLFNVL